MIDLENRFRYPNQSNPKSMDAVFVRMIGVRKKAQSVLLSTMRARCTPKYTLLSPAPTQLKKSGKNRSFSFLENDAGHWERLPAENGEFVLSPSETQPHPFPLGSFWAFFFWSKTSGKKIRRSSTRNDSSRENNWPTENTNTSWERWAGWNTHWWWPQTWWNFFWKTPPLQCKVTQRLISVLKQHPDEIGLSKCVLKATTIDKKLYAAVSLLPHDAAASPSCAKRKRWIYSNMTPRNDRCSDMRFSRKNALPNIRIQRAKAGFQRVY